MAVRRLEDEENELLGITDEAERQEREEALQKQLALQEYDDLRSLLAIPSFRRFIWSVLDEAKVGPGDYVGSGDPLDIGKWMGERHVWHFILNKLLTADPLVYTTLYKEAFFRDKREKDMIDVSHV